MNGNPPAPTSGPTAGRPATAGSIATAPLRVAGIADAASSCRPEVRAEEWTVRGDAKVLGEVDVGTARILGSLSVRGRLGATSLSLGSDSELFGPVTVVKRMEARGELRSGATLSVGELDVVGRLSATGAVTSTGGVRVVGAVVSPGEFRVGETFAFDAHLEIEGTVTAATVDGRVRGRSRVAALVAPSVRIRRGAKVAGEPARLDVLRIDARSVDIEGVYCEYIRAEKVRLGPGCHVVRIDGDVTGVDRTSRVGPEAPFTRLPGKFR